MVKPRARLLREEGTGQCGGGLQEPPLLPPTSSGLFFVILDN